MKTVRNCCGMRRIRSVYEKRAIMFDNESGQPKMAENACWGAKQVLRT